MRFQDFDIRNLPRNQAGNDWLEVTSPASGENCQLPFLFTRGAEDGPTVLVTAGIHGDEYEGIEAIPNIFAQLELDSFKGTLLMLPTCNKPAYETAQRCSPIDGLNMARVFPGDKQGTMTECLAYWITGKCLTHADFLIDLHSAGIAYDIPTLVGYIHSDDNLGQCSRVAAEAFGAPILWGHPLPIPTGRSISAATDLGIPSLYTEAPGGGYSRASDVACFTDGVINVLKHLDMLSGLPKQHVVSHDLLGDGNLDSVISAGVEGYFQSRVKLLDEVKRCDCLGTIKNPMGQVVEEIFADNDGVIIMIRRLHRVGAGDGLIHITGYLADRDEIMP